MLLHLGRHGVQADRTAVCFGGSRSCCCSGCRRCAAAFGRRGSSVTTATRRHYVSIVAAIHLSRQNTHANESWRREGGNAQKHK